MIKKSFVILSATILLIACNNENSKVEELEKKINEQNVEMQSMKESMLEKEIEEKNKEIDALKSQEQLNTNQRQKSDSQKGGPNEDKFHAEGYGKYALASNRLLTYNDIANLPKSELTIMRNEIFARHGYIFKTTEMINYFTRQSWYRPLYDDVFRDLSDIEKKNIEFIKSFE